MNAIHQLHDEIAVVGWSCRLPGANSIPALWSLLLEGRCAVSRVPDDRFPLAKFSHPRRQERGKSYTFAAGVLDDIWGFDPAVFRISPREAEQMDPQQRLILQLTWEALEDAGIRPSAITGTDVGVFIGGSLTDYANALYGDPALGDAHFATGNALACLSNRVSYVFNLHGPSMTVDTACSSSLVALHQAAEALRSGRIDTAIVGGINIIASPMSFVTFSQASMLSPTGLCQAFDAKADGFVRAEGGAVLVLRKASLAAKNQNPIHGVILASDVNSDGRTNGISLPSAEAQENLLQRVYARAGIEPSRLAFVEAHGTGTAVGDPIEARAIGRGLGQERDHPLPIGSVKTNVGHLEPASGMAGVLKALLALNHGVLPPSLHFDKPNPNIDFEQLNLTVCDTSLLLPNVRQQCAGVNSFGFGGTNAHVVVGPGRKPLQSTREDTRTRFFAISAETKPALAALAKSYTNRIAALTDSDTAKVAGAAAYRRERLSHKLVVSSTRRADVLEALDAFVAGNDHPQLTTGVALGTEQPTAFVFSGNGSQRVGMGTAAYQWSETFRDRFDQIDGHFRKIAGWSLKEAMFSDKLGERLDQTSVAQPLIFAIQVAITAALRERGLRPAAVLGHSVGEVAAAEAAGILNLQTAIKVIHYRSKHQESVRRAGGMAVISAGPDVAGPLVAMVDGVEIAALNSPRSVTVAGRVEALAQFRTLVRSSGIAYLDLKLDYPFHTSLMQAIEAPLIADLRDVIPNDAPIPFVSTVTGSIAPGSRIDARYWWRNVREPVQFINAVRETAKLGVRSFIEIGPSPLLQKHIAESLAGEAEEFSTLAVLTGDEQGDPFDRTVARALVAGAQVDHVAVFGADPGAVQLPNYPWQQTPYRFTPTQEAVGVIEESRHPLAGARFGADSLEWRAHIDTALLPELADHRVGTQVLFPGTGFLEIGFAVAQQWLKSDKVTLANFEILRPLDLTGGETQEVMTHVAPGSNTLEILSRRRLSKSGWIVNCRAKMLHATGASGQTVPVPAKIQSVIDRKAFYRLSDSCGLHYGPAFQLSEGLAIHDDDLITVELVAPRSSSPYVVDPMRLDACIQGVIAMFPEFRAAERGVAYVPVRLDEATTYVPGAAPRRAIIEVLSKTERSMLTNIYVLGMHDEVIACLRGARCQSIPVRRTENLESIAIGTTLVPADGALLGETGVSASPDDILAAAKSRDLLAESSFLSNRARLLEGWATAAAYEITSGLTDDDDAVHPDLLIQSRRLPVELRLWLINLLHHLEATGLAHSEGVRWRLENDTSLPGSSAFVSAIAAEFPDRAAELLLASEISEFSGRVASERAIRVSPSDILTPAALDFSAIAGTATATTDEILWSLLQSGVFPTTRALRILQIGVGPLAQRIVASKSQATVTIFEPNDHQLDRAQSGLPRRGDIVVAKELGTYDLIVAADGTRNIPLANLHAALAPNGLIIAVEPVASLFRDLVFGLNPAWFKDSLADFPVGELRRADEWQSQLTAAGFERVSALTIRSADDLATLVIGAARSTIDAPAVAAPAATVVKAAARSAGALSSAIAKAVTADGDAQETILCVGGLDRDSVSDLTDRCLEIKALAERTKGRIWLVFSNALGTDPVSAGAWVFSRTLANELSHLDVRRIDLGEDVAPATAAQRIKTILQSKTNETELRIDATAIRVVRADSIRRTAERNSHHADAAQLQRGQSSSNRLQWQPIDRSPPGASEVEIAVEATGVNFRDLMWSLGMLPDDILEDGFSGPALGLECAGKVVRVGSAVKDFKAGDSVLALAGSAYATHVNVPARQVAKVPAGMSLEAAATIPVAFLTAYYSLITQAKLARNEWVLIHGGAGGVGLAAIQVARMRGARVIATGGSNAKRSLLKALGVEHVLDSRSTAFVDGVREITGDGVDVVLNSLSSEAMEQSIACMRAFGRFVELGKRDYVANTHIGLRAFRKNQSYFGVDVDQLVGRGDVGPRILNAILRRFEQGSFTPLPYTVFDSTAVSDAFNLMQQSAHIGKIVVRPPQPGTIPLPHAPFKVDPHGTHVVTGAFGGFGLETARWLVDKGARHLVLLGRRGAATEEARAAIRSFTERGVKLLHDPVDVSDRTALARIFAKAKATLPPIVGVIHAAAVLDDCIIGNLDAGRMQRVLEPKLRGADNLDALTRGMALNYFVLYSSVTTLIGNPGQGNYVAANAYMEGLTRKRRREGLPGLAIGWGPISDVGLVARNQKLQAGLEKLTGARGMTAREALDLMAQALERSAGSPELSVMTIAPNDGSFGGDRLAILRSPTYAALLHGGAGEGAAQAIDLRALIATEEPEIVSRKVADLIVAQLARVLHAREEEISRARPLGEIGLDSLMGLELGMQLEDIFGMKVPLAGSAGNLTVTGLTEEIIAQVTRTGDSGGAPALAAQHGAKLDPEQIEALRDLDDPETQARDGSTKRILH